MQNSSENYQVGSINFAPKDSSAGSSLGTSFSKPQQIASFSVPIAHGPRFHITFLLGYLKKLWMKHHYSDAYPFHCICSENPCSILELMKALTILREEDMRLFLQQMDFCLDSILSPSGKLIKSSGATKKTSRFHGRSTTGKISRLDSSKKGRTRHGKDSR